GAACGPTFRGHRSTARTCGPQLAGAMRNTPTTKTVLARFSLALALALAPAPVLGQGGGGPEEVARRVLERTPLFDGHNDLPWAIREYEAAPRDVRAYDLRGTVPGHTDIARLRRGMV